MEDGGMTTRGMNCNHSELLLCQNQLGGYEQRRKLPSMNQPICPSR